MDLNKCKICKTGKVATILNYESQMPFIKPNKEDHVLYSEQLDLLVGLPLLMSFSTLRVHLFLFQIML